MSTNASEFSDLDNSPNPEHWIQMMLQLPEMAPAINQIRALMFAPIKDNQCTSVLDGGCGPGIVTADMANQLPEALEVIGLDMSDHMLNYARDQALPKSVSFAKGSLCDIPFESNRFDAVRVERVLHHIADNETAVKELVRVCRPGGVIVACEPDVRRIYVHPVTPEDGVVFSRRYSEFMAAGDIAPFLPAMFERAGAHVESQTTVSMTFRDLDNLQEGFDSIEELRNTLREAHHEDDVERLDQAIERHEAFLDVPMTIVVARKLAS
ncbi:Demethylmenaquinone methyltransferase [BD1-7 clade bacterium]|uniref:Demethylmenaquinone methyltransferase n=1 Tax=BD1-7 clade bacterium TaxID=2029982 RepID=A0A5S9PS76_9GAMM|nr:Demethylmenaquinone methyltransferase [BD1-7 clade bacterium]